jgi:hypothetical protein
MATTNLRCGDLQWGSRGVGRLRLGGWKAMRLAGQKAGKLGSLEAEKL